MSEADHPHKGGVRKSKKKRGSMSHMKAMAKQGQYGLGQPLQEDEYNYFMAIAENLKTVTGEEKDALLRSFFSEFCEEKGERFVCNQIISRMVDDLLPEACVESVQQLITVLSSDLWAVSTDQFASHVLQSVLAVVSKYAQDDSNQRDWDDSGQLLQVAVTVEDRQTMLQFLGKVAMYCHNNLHDFTVDGYASHVVRSLLQVLAGVASDTKGSKRAQTQHQLLTAPATGSLQHAPPQFFTDKLLLIANRLMTVADLPNCVSGECGSAVFQCALQVLRHRHSDACSALASHLLGHAFPVLQDEPSDCPHPVFNAVCTSKLLEVVIENSSGDELVNIYSTYFAEQLSSLVQHQVGNYAVQRLLDAWQDKESFDDISAAIAPLVPSVLESRYYGVLLSWTKTCARLNTHQGKCFIALMEALDCHEPEERQVWLAPLLLHLLPHDTYHRLMDANNPPKVSLHGALLLQELLKFRKPIKAVKSLLHLPTSRLVQLLQDPRGSHVTDVFCTSAHIGEKSRLALVDKVANDAVALACSKHGSRSLEALWQVASPPARVNMCQRLADSALTLKANEFGAILYSKFNVRLFSKSDRQDWADLEQKKANKRKKLKELLDVQQLTESEPPRKKKKRKTDDLAMLKSLISE